MSNKTTIEIFATPGSTDTAYIAGPLSIYASVNTVEELYAPELIATIVESGVINPIIFVGNVFNQTPSNMTELKNRGAYYILEKWIIEKIQPSYQEILIGSGFEAATTLRVIGELDLSIDGFLKFTKGIDGNYHPSVESIRNIPDLPKYITDQGVAYKEQEDWINKNKNTWYHLDAKLEELGPIGDINNPDHNAKAYGSCQELYELLYSVSDNVITVSKIGNRPHFEISPKNGTAYQTVYLKDTLISYNKILKSPTNSNFSLVSFSNVIGEGILFNPDNDYLLLSINDEFISSLNFTFTYSATTHVLTINILNSTLSQYINTDILFSVILIKNKSNIPELEMVTLPEIYQELSIPTTGMSISMLKVMIYQLYVINRQAQISPPKNVYLTNDVFGNMVWGNDFVANNNFRNITKVIQYADCELTATNEAIINLGPNDIQLSSTLLAFLDNFKIPTTSLFYTGNILYLKIPINQPYWDPDMSTFNLQCIFITDGVIDTIHELANSYLTKRDAVDILTRGTLTLNDYTQKSDLSTYSKIGHSHGSYSAIGHSHDYRYAEYFHTHPSFIQLPALLGILETLELINFPTTKYVPTLDIFAIKDKTYYTKLGNVYDPHVLNEGDPIGYYDSTSSSLNNSKNLTAEIEKIYYKSITSPVVFTERLVSPGEYYRFITAPEGFSGQLYVIELVDGDEVFVAYAGDRVPGIAYYYDISDARTIWVKDINMYASVWYELVNVVSDIIDDTVAVKEMLDTLINTYSNETVGDIITKFLMELGYNVGTDGKLINAVPANKVYVTNSVITEYVGNIAPQNVEDVFEKLISDIGETTAEEVVFTGSFNRSQVELGGFQVGDVIPDNVQDFMETLLTPRNEALKYVPASFKINFFNKINGVLKPIDVIEIGMVGKIFCGITILNKSSEPIATRRFTVFINNIETSPLDYYYELPITTFDQNQTFNFKVDVRYTSSEDIITLTDTVILKSSRPIIMTLSTNVDTLNKPLKPITFQELNLNIADFVKTRENEIISNHSFSNKYFIFAVQEGKNFKIFDLKYDMNITNAVLEITTTSFPEYPPLIGSATLKYDFYAIATLDTLIKEPVKYKITIVEEV